jgi:squalene synthase HpnC
MELHTAYQRCTLLARKHYENFPVGRFVPRELARHIHAIYAFARLADDIADEGYEAPFCFADGDGVPRKLTQEERLERLDRWEQALYHPERFPEDPVAQALAHTIATLELSKSLFSDLLSAFRQDVLLRRYQTFDQVLDYCRRSANPIGRLVLLVHGIKSPVLMEKSDAICTALQLTNFWQDLAVDIRKDRIYLPQEEMQKFGVTEEDLQGRSASYSLRRLLALQVERTFLLFGAGEDLPRLLPWPLSLEIQITCLGGRRILEKIVDQKYDTLARRPRLRSPELPGLLLNALFCSAFGQEFPETDPATR